MTSPAAAPAAVLTVVEHLRDELFEIESIFAACQGDRSVGRYRVPYVPSEDGCLIALYDAWVRFVREFLLTCAAGPVLGLSGSVYTPATAMPEAAALTHIHTHRRGTRISFAGGEPKWADGAALPDLTSVLGLSNANVIVSALSASTVNLGFTSVANPIEHMRVCRNYAAHKGPSAMAQAVTVVGGFTSMSLLLRRRHSGVETFSVWVEASIALAEAAAQ